MSRSIKDYYSIMLAILAINVMWLFPETANAIVQPAVGDFGYDIYDIAVNDILQGPIGFVGGLATIVIGAVFCCKAAIHGSYSVYPWWCRYH